MRDGDSAGPAALTERQAFNAMIMFLERWNYETGGDWELAILLGEIGFLPDGDTADPAAWHVWNACVERVLGMDESDDFFSQRLFLDEDARRRFIDENYSWYRAWNTHWPEKPPRSLYGK